MFQLLGASAEVLTLQRRFGGPVEGPDAGFHLKTAKGDAQTLLPGVRMMLQTHRQTDRWGGGPGSALSLSLSFMLLPWSCRTWKCNQDT